MELGEHAHKRQPDPKARSVQGGPWSLAERLEDRLPVLVVGAPLGDNLVDHLAAAERELALDHMCPCRKDPPRRLADDAGERLAK